MVNARPGRSALRLIGCLSEMWRGDRTGQAGMPVTATGATPPAVWLGRLQGVDCAKNELPAGGRRKRQAAPDFSEAANWCDTLFFWLSALSGHPLNHAQDRSVWSERSTRHLLRNRRAGNQIVSTRVFGTAEFQRTTTHFGEPSRWCAWPTVATYTETPSGAFRQSTPNASRVGRSEMLPAWEAPFSPHR